VTVPNLTTRRPTGKPPWPMLLIAGVEKAGKSYSGALLSASDLVDRTFWIEIGEGAADQYGSIPGARYEIAEHDGTYQGIGNAIYAATMQPRPNGKPHAIVIDSMTELWDLLADEAQGVANERAARKRGNKPTDSDAQITMDLWNTAKKRWRRIVDTVRTYDGPVILTARLELVTVMDDGGKPTTAKDWKIRSEKNLPYECDAIVRMPAPGVAELTGVRSLRVQVPPGGALPLPGFTLERLLTDLGLDREGATSPRSYTAPRSVPADAEADGERPAQRQRPAGPVDDEWSTPNAPSGQLPPPSPLVPTASKAQLTKLSILLGEKRGLTERDACVAAVAAMVRRPLKSRTELSKAEANSVITTLSAEPDHVPLEDNPVRDVLTKLIADASTHNQLAEAGQDIVNELARGNITAAEADVLRGAWKQRSAALHELDAMHQEEAGLMAMAGAETVG
jgi:hypothetical protein